MNPVRHLEGLEGWAEGLGAPREGFGDIRCWLSCPCVPRSLQQPPDPALNSG